MKGWLRRLRQWLGPKVSTEAAPQQGTPAPPRPSEAPPRLPFPLRAERTLIVGVDFGTSSTKVVWQDLTDNHFEAFHWKLEGGGCDALLLPSVVVIRDQAIHFAVSEREKHDQDIRLGSIKLCVLCHSNHAICRCGSSVAQQGVVRLPNLSSPHPASAIAALFLAYVFRRVESRLTTRFHADNLLILWNVGCPMDHLDSLGLKDEWERMVGAALELRHEVSNPVGVSMLTDVTARLNDFVVRNESERNYFVQPEGLAAIKAFLESPHAESKTYAIVDVGAGTTEVSFFFNGQIMTEPDHPLRPCYLADSTQAAGGGKIDLELAKSWNCTLDDARLRKETSKGSIPYVPSIGEVCAQYERTCWQIIENRRLTSPRNKRFDLFVIGGGGRLRPLQDALRRHPLPGNFVREGWRELEPPKNFKDRSVIRGDYDFLAIACGLASSLEWDYYPPREVPPMPELPVRPPRSADEYYTD